MTILLVRIDGETKGVDGSWSLVWWLTRNCVWRLWYNECNDLGCVT
jgi:hypothetical protein